MKKREEAAAEDAKLALQEFESLSKQLNNSAETENVNTGTTSGRRTFGAMKKPAPEPKNKMKSENYYGGSDGEDDNEAREDVDAGDHKSSSSIVDVNIVSDIICEDSKRHQNSVFKVGMFHNSF